MTLGNIPKRRFIELDVNEVSLVDSPANEQEFIVIKRIQEENMKDKNNIEKQTNGVLAGEEEQEVKTEKENSNPLNEVVQQVSSLIKEITKESDSQQEVEKQVENKIEKQAENEEITLRSMYKSLLQTNGINDEKLENAMKEFDNKTNIVEKKDDEKVQKEDIEKNDENIPKILEALENGIRKAKTFTPKREQAIKQAIETLQKLMTDIQTIPMNSSPKNTLPQGTQFGNSAVIQLTKCIEELTTTFKSSLDKMTTVTKSLGERIDEIEKTRNPSKSLTNDDEVTTNKQEQSFWNNVL